MMKLLDKIEEYLCICCLVVMTALVFANVFSRYVLHASFSFSEEITTNLFVLLSMMGTAIAAKRQAHLGLSIVTDRVSPKARRALLIFGYGLATVFSAAVLVYGILMVRSEYILGQVTAAMQWPEFRSHLYDHPLCADHPERDPHSRRSGHDGRGSTDRRGRRGRT